MFAATVEEVLNTDLGTAAFLLFLFGVFIWAYIQNKNDHNALGEKVDKNSNELKELIQGLTEKIDAVRQAITDHETIWHAPTTTKSQRVRKTAKKK